MNEHTVAIVSFEGALKREIKKIREQLKACENVKEMHLKIIVSGRVHTGDLKLTFALSESEYSTGVEGDSIGPVVEEHLRRHGWSAIHAPKAIGYEKIPSDNTVEENTL